jgi:hypothetical protein
LSNSTLPKFHGDLLDFQLWTHIPSDLRQNAVSDEDLIWISTQFDLFERIAAGNPAFRFALEAAFYWRFAKDTRTAVAHLWSGIEAIFQVSQELVYRLSTYSACLLTPRGDARKHKYREVKTLYGQRSKIVHGERITEPEVLNAMNTSYALLRDLLVLTISKGRALNDDDFLDAVFS